MPAWTRAWRRRPGATSARRTMKRMAARTSRHIVRQELREGSDDPTRQPKHNARLDAWNVI